MAKSQQTKKCSCCNELKPTTEFWKHQKTKDGLQGYCKPCGTTKSNRYTLKTTIGSIYKITNPEGISYIGKTFKKLKYRFTLHKSTAKNSHKYEKPSHVPLLFASFDKWGIENHTFELVDEYPNISKEALREIETNLIQVYQKANKSLNTNK